MYVIAEIQGKQYKFRKNEVIEVERLAKGVGEDGRAPIHKLDKILFCSNGSESLIGQPYLKDVKVEAEVLGESKGKKVVAFKFKRRKGYHKKIGHRQKYTKLKILKIEAPLTEKKVERKKAEKPKVKKVKTEVRPKTMKKHKAVKK